jgi:hypothetical protein
VLYVIDGNRREAEATARGLGVKQGTFKYVTNPEALGQAKPGRDRLAVGSSAARHPEYYNLIQAARRVGFSI